MVVVYKVDRLTRSLADFAKMVELFDAHGVSFVAVTQQFIYGPLPSARPAKVCTAMIRAAISWNPRWCSRCAAADPL